MRTLIAMILLASVLIAGTRTDRKLRVSDDFLNSDSLVVVNESRTITGADTVYTGVFNLDDVELGWGSISYKFTQNTSSSQSFAVSARDYSEFTGFGDWVVVSSAVAVDTKTSVDLSTLDMWIPMAGIQFRIISSGSGTVTPNVVLNTH